MIPHSSDTPIEHPNASVEAHRAHSDWFAALQALLARQRETAARLRVLAARQESLISAGYGDALLVLLGERQQAIDELLRSQAELAPFIPDMNRRLAALPIEQREDVRAALDEISAALDEVMRGDDRDQKAIQARRSAVREELGAMSAGRIARNAYLRPAMRQARVADRLG
jgi:hypothetical protein